MFLINLQSLHKVFWKNGLFDESLKHEHEIKEKAKQLQYINCVKKEEIHLRSNRDLSRNLNGLGAEVMEMLWMFERHNPNHLAKVLDVFEEALVGESVAGISIDQCERKLLYFHHYQKGDDDSPGYAADYMMYLKP